ncbi:BMP family ABC transporter substrate-binding protein [Actinocorallia herbida]|uniref:BMP family ABC transporter substrate-binding protein n=1 Tax=Actinocorallia herbida TaxID=58109 RepID=UPI000F4B5E14|nr:BMP family ABC transporter substrate-binding protein [Actinocorallia herbida]
MRLAIAAGVVALVPAVAFLIAFGTDDGDSRARPYLEFKACLLTDAEGLLGKDAAPVWQGMQRASLETRAKVQYLAVTGPQTVAGAGAFVGSLVGLRCDLVVAPAGLPADAVGERAEAYPGTRFLVVGGSAEGANVSRVAGNDVPGEVARVVAEAVSEAEG